MDKRKLNRITMAFVVLTVLVVGLMLSHTLHRTSHITLPDVLPSAEDGSGGNEQTGGLAVVEIAPETVQAAIATLKRPEQYRRTVTVEQLWNGGSGSYSSEVAVMEGWTRTDRSFPDGQTRHAVTDGEKTYIWYNDRKDMAELSAGEISADNEQAIPTYENILQLTREDIAAADYRDLNGLRCIYVETAELDDGYVQRYWVSVDTGLLAAAEKLSHGETVYRMAAMELDISTPLEELFVLPNGKKLI